ncbi:hypothetical protein HDU91_003382 [Kappamyces sp. JEL0680]|nr:hypothetical protein HDU91_003382 [Kappamyces sp. JEL0680]
MHFIKLDVDQVQQVAAEQGISAMPTFKVYLQGREIKDMRGADRNGLERLVKESIEFHAQAYSSQAKARHEQKKAAMGGPVTESRQELMGKSIKELKEMLTSRSISLVGLAEKSDLVERLLSWAGRSE